MMGKIPEAWRIISGTGIYNRRPDILRLRRIDLRNSGGISVWGGEPLEALRTAGNSRGRLAWPSPLRLVQRYSKCSPLTVLLWPQVQNYSLTKLRLILARAMASAIQALISGWGTADWKVNAPPWPSADEAQDADGQPKNSVPSNIKPAEQGGGTCSATKAVPPPLTTKHPQMRSRCLWLT